jgi:hypothetical protein
MGAAPGEDEAFEQGVGGEAVGAVDSGAGDLTDGEEAEERGATEEVGADAAHPVVGCGRNGDRLGVPVETASTGCSVDGGEAFGEEVRAMFCGEDGGVEQDGLFWAAIWRAMPLATTSRGASSASAWMCCMKRRPLASSNRAPSPRTASEMRKVSGETSAVGWNW